MRRTAETIADELLVMRCQDGEADALDALVRRWQRPLWRHAWRLTGNVEAAWDATQDGWAGILRGLGKLDDPARFRAWAYRIVTHKAVDWVRSRRKAAANRPLAADPAAAADAREDDRVGRIRVALDRLPPAMRVILALRYRDELGTAEIAEILGIPAGTVKSRLHHARGELKRLVEGE